MRTINLNKNNQHNLPVSFNSRELDLAKEWDEYCFENCITRSSAIKRMNKRELKEDKWISFYGTNSQIAHMIKRNRLDIKAVRVMRDGAELYYDPDAIKAFYTLVRLRD